MRKLKNSYVWDKDANAEYYYDGLGNMVYGQQNINGKWQYFDTKTGNKQRIVMFGSVTKTSGFTMTALVTWFMVNKS